MSKDGFHPNAYLTRKRNVRNGLSARTRILTALEKSNLDARSVSQATQLSYGAVMHHLRLLRVEKIVESVKGKKYIWRLTGLGQKELNAFK